MDTNQTKSPEAGNENKNRKHRNFRRHRRGGKRPQENREQQVKKEEVTPVTVPEPVMEEAIVPPAEEITVPLPEAPEKTNAEEIKAEAVSIRFRPAGKNYSFDPDGMTFTMGEKVIVETSQGKEFGTVSIPNRTIAVKPEHFPLKKVLRRANEKDIQKSEENRQLEMEARRVFHEKVASHELEMVLSDVECSFDRSKLIFYFTSDGRVDFREFVKDMASIFKTRIELRQIGVRDEAKQLGGLGICGRPLCCSSFLDDFQQVSIKMAKEQNLSLNPTKISGTCGRLMCCLRYENDAYVEASRRCPKVDAQVSTPQGNGVVLECNILREKCKVKLDSDPENIVVFRADELKTIPKVKKNPQGEKQGKEKQEDSKENQ